MEELSSSHQQTYRLVTNLRGIHLMTEREVDARVHEATNILCN